MDGSKVIIPKEKKTFEKGYTRKWSDEVLTIEKNINSTPTTYLLSNGKFSYASELQFLNDKQVKVLTKKRN